MTSTRWPSRCSPTGNWSSPARAGTVISAVLLRYTTAGVLDTSFDSDGIFEFGPSGQNIELLTSIAIQSDGKIVAAGSIVSGFLPSHQALYDTLVLRLNANGSLDTTFDGDGIVRERAFPARDGIASTMKLLPNGKILTVGSSFDFANMDLAAARFNTDGSPDRSFDFDGTAVFDLHQSDEEGFASAIDAQGRFRDRRTSRQSGDGLSCQNGRCDAVHAVRFQR